VAKITLSKTTSISFTYCPNCGVIALRTYSKAFNSIKCILCGCWIHIEKNN
jgi:predicted RNA-binding Zn-ribbon protein involved in translation (DUF1610 family)